MVEALGPLSARPPTPPRTSRPFADPSRAEDSPIVQTTPRDSPFSANASTGAPSSRQSKRVNFSPWPTSIKPPSFTNASAKSSPDVKTLPPSNECKPVKSILKATQAAVPVPLPTSDEPLTPESFAMLLESITQELASESISSRLDAYMQFFGALRAYEELPGEKSMAEKLGLITQFIQRDVKRDCENGGPGSTNLVIQALKLAAALVWHSGISAQLPDDFKIFVVDQSINSLHDPQVPKSVLTHYMSILSTQNFNPKIMTNSRLTRLLTALHNVTTRVNGSSIVAQRLNIYQRVLGQSKTTFVSHASLWMEHLISGLLHHIKDIRVKAISLGFQTSITLGPNPTLSKCVRDVFDRSLDKNRKLVSEICERMSRMMSNSDSGIHVPQVWSVFTLLLRNKRFNVDQWDHFKEWVLVLQKCFNCSDSAIKAQAIVGWNRFVLVVGPSESTSRSMLKMLSKPILSQFERKKHERNGLQPSFLALCSYYNLLYYAFRPSASFQHLDNVWEEYIALPSSNMFASSHTLSDKLAQVLSNMLWSSQAKVWVENKVIESNKLDPEDLPCIDCRWVRSRIRSVLKVFENIFKSSLWGSELEKSNVASAWANLSTALAFASSKEITPSAELMQAVASVLGLLQRLWIAGPSSLGAADQDQFFDRFRFLSTTMISALGSTPFTEKLFLKTADETFQAANTPTHRHPKSNLPIDSPLLHILRLINDVSRVEEPTPSYSRLVASTLEAASNGRTSRGSRIELLRQCSDLYQTESDVSLRAQGFSQTGWKSVAQLAAVSLSSYPLESARERDGSVSRDYDNTIKILTSGLKFPGASKAWNELTDALVRVVRNEKGHREIALVVVEPLADRMMSCPVEYTYLPTAAIFMHSLSIPFTDESAAHERGDLAQDSAVPFPSKLIQSVTRTLNVSYNVLFSSNRIANFIESLTSFLGSGTLSFRVALLESLQQPLALWFKDEARKLNVESGVESRTLTACRALSSAAVNILQISSPGDTLFVQKFETIICAGLESSHSSIAKRFIDFWHSKASPEGSSVVSENISRAVQRFESSVEVEKPVSHTEQEAGVYAKSTATTEANSSRPEMSAKSRIAFILDNVGTSQPADITSSPVTKAEPTAVLEQPGEPEIRQASHEGDGPDTGLPDESANHIPENTYQRNEIFSMIENLRSSSPANTPRLPEFWTPPHLRNLRNLETGETPQTPTLPPTVAEHEDSFLGSSPTPSARARTPNSRQNAPLSMETSAVDAPMALDPPSSPPQMSSMSPDPGNNSQTRRTSSPEKQGGSKNNTPRRSRSERAKKRNNARRNSARRSSRANSAETTERKQQQPLPQEPMTTRLRSSASQTLPHAEAAPVSLCQEPEHAQANDAGSAGATESHTLPKKTRPFASGELHNNDHEDSSPLDLNSDSLSDDMETQLASQLGESLEGAVHDEDNSGNTHHEEAAEQPQVSKKRKRETEEVPNTPQSKDLRRSSRRSTSKPSVVVDEESRSTRSKKPSAPAASQEVDSPAESALKKRRTGDKEDTAVGDSVVAAYEEPRSTRSKKPSASAASHEADSPTKSSPKKRRTGDKQDNAVRNAEAEPGFDEQASIKTENSQTRKSSRLSGVPGPDIPEETPDAKPSPARSQSRRSPHSSKSKNRATNRSRRQNESQKEGAAEGAATAAKHEPIPEDALQETGETAQESHLEIVEPQPLTEDTTVGHEEPSQEPVSQIDETQAAQPERKASVDHAPEMDAPTNEPAEPVLAETTPVPQNEQRPSPTNEVQMADAEAPTQPSTTDPDSTGSQALIASLRRLLGDAKQTTVDRSSLREIDDLLFDIRVETHEAFGRHSRQG